jgi:hypothetical protein
MERIEAADHERYEAGADAAPAPAPNGVPA